MTAFVPAYAPTYGSAAKRNYRVRENEFGDGYTAHVKDGLNNVVQVWELTWANMRDSNVNDIEDQLDSFAGTAFEWTTPKGETLSFTSGAPTRTYAGYDHSNLSVTFTQDFSS